MGGGVEGEAGGGGGNQVIKFRPPSQHLRREVQTTNPAAEPAQIRLRGIVRTVLMYGCCCYITVDPKLPVP